MPRLSNDTYLAAVRAESARFRDVLADADPTAVVPSCPDWTASDLLWHLTEVQRWWAEVVTARPDRPADLDPERPDRPADLDPERPDGHAALLAAFDAASAALSTALEGADPRDEAWNWSPDHTVGFIVRRQAHEALVHRVDAELAAGVSSPLDAELAADGVHEVLDVMFGGMPPWGSWEPGDDLVRVDATDTGTSVWVRFGRFSGTHPESGRTYVDEEDFHVVEPPADDVEPDVVIDGTAADLDLWLWHRADGVELATAGDPGVLARFRAIVGSAID